MDNGMNQWLAECYDTPGAATSEDLQKVAEAELFAKLASENGFDLNAMTDEQVTDLWNKVAGDKIAMDMPPQFGDKKDEKKKDEKKDDKKDEEEAEKEAAAQEFAMQKAASDQIAFMDYCGRVMAHAYVNELTKIGQSMAGEGEKTASSAPQLLDNLSQGGAAAATAEAPEDVNDRIQKLASGAPAAAAAAPSSTANIDMQAARHAVELAKQAGLDPNITIQKLNAVLTLGPNESTKIASAQTIEEAVGTRALELLEQAGFEVNWNQ